LFALFVLANEIVQINSPHEVKYIFYYSNLVLAYYQLSTFFLLTALYFLLNQKKGRIYWTLLVLIITGIVLNVWNWIFSVFIISNLLILEIVRIAFKALKNKQRGAWIIASGAISYFVFYLMFILGVPFNYIYNQISQNYTIGDLTYNLQFLSIPVATSIYLALDFAFTSRSLEQKLVEVNILSEEKQQILANQNQLLEQQVTERTAALNQSLEQLKATQSQLIQSAKMASLGELTAGIAHEIQNPLNFVNNFSDVNKELIAEMKEEIDKGNVEEVKVIANDLEENEQKISHHGKRADAIVKGMLQHSRASTGKKEPTDINALADEYLRLSYHGLRAKDKDFNADFKTNFDESIGKVEVVPQDIGRVLLNLYNNAFYAVNEKKKAPTLKGENYEPIVWVTTKRISSAPHGGAGGLEISVRDNGPGISSKILDKIYQPFFTTKPTGQGTGLGLSLSYDIIKAHGGELKVQTKEGELTSFTIQLPI
jgi:signal transduction histidine kinase